MRMVEVKYNGKTGVRINRGKKRTPLIMFSPEGGWKEQSLYLVRASFGPNNPIGEYFFYTGFIQDGIPQNYNEILLTEGFNNINSLIYLEAVKFLHKKEYYSPIKCPIYDEELWPLYKES